MEKPKLSFERIRHLTQVEWDGKKRGSLQTEGSAPKPWRHKRTWCAREPWKTYLLILRSGTHDGVSKSESFYPTLQRDDTGGSIRKNAVSRVPPKTFGPSSQ